MRTAIYHCTVTGCILKQALLFTFFFKIIENNKVELMSTAIFTKVVPEAFRRHLIL